MFDTPICVLVRPQMGENIGAAARAMLNFGWHDMRLVAPRDGWPNPSADAMAAGAVEVLGRAAVVDTLPGAAGDCHFIFATTARPRDLAKPVFTSETAIAEARRRMGRGERVGFLFGPERAGLDNDEIAQANAIVTVPVNPGFPSINLAQCVLLIAYEWQRQQDGWIPEGHAIASATLAEVDRWASHFEREIDAAGFFFPPAKAPHMRRSLRNLWSRMPLRSQDVQVLHGALRQLVRRRDADG